MSQNDMSSAIKKFGLYAGVRYLKKRGVSFEDAYRAVFGKTPRISA